MTAWRGDSISWQSELVSHQTDWIFACGASAARAHVHYAQISSHTHTRITYTGNIMSKQERLLLALVVHLYLRGSQGVFLKRCNKAINVCEKEMTVLKLK